MSVRKEMEEVIKRGQSVLHSGVVYTNIDDLPSEAELAKGDASQEEAAKRSIKAQMHRLQTELEMLDADKKASAKKAEAPSSEKKAEAPKAENSAKSEAPAKSEEGGKA